MNFIQLRTFIHNTEHTYKTTQGCECGLNHNTASYSIDPYLTNTFQYSEISLHMLVVAMLSKPQTRFQIVKNDLY